MKTTQITLLDAVTLTSAFSGNRASFPTDDVETVHLEVTFTPNASGGNNRYIELLVETSYDAATWIPHSSIVDGQGYNAVYNHGIFRGPFDSSGMTVTTAGTAYYFDIDIAVAARNVRVAAREDGAANFGTSTVRATLVHREGQLR